jgi:hypothetical protein
LYRLQRMLRYLCRKPESSVLRAEARGSSAGVSDRQIVVFGVLLTTIALAYFYAADNYYFSTRFMSSIFQYLLMVDDFNTAWLTFAVCILATWWRNPAPFIKVVEFLGKHALPVAAAAVVLIAFAAVFVYHGNAFSMDEYAAVFQAKIFASGRLTARLPPSVVDWLVPPGFNGVFLIASKSTGQAIESYWPGFSLLLAPFEFLGIPWLCNACLAGLAILLIHRITLEITNDLRAAGWALLFTLASGAFIANAISYYSMQAHLTANLLFAWLLLKPNPYRAFGAGVVGSLALVLHNPFPHAVFALPWIVAIARSERIPRNLFWLMLGYLPLVILLGVGWLHLRADVNASSSAVHAMNSGIGSAFSLPDKSMIDMRVAAAVKMWIWAVPCLFLFAFLGFLRKRDDQRVRLLAASAMLTFVAYLFVIFDQGHGWGYRYFHSAWGVIPILGACAMTGRAESDGRLAAFAGAAAILNLLIVVPLQLTHINEDISRHSAQIPAPHRPGNNVYFISAAAGFYLADLAQIDPLLRDQDLLLFSHGQALDAELRRQNWPGAALVARSFGVEEWSLGPMDQRRPSPYTPGVDSWVFAYSRAAPRGGSNPSDVTSQSID